MAEAHNDSVQESRAGLAGRVPSRGKHLPRFISLSGSNDDFGRSGSRGSVPSLAETFVTDSSPDYSATLRLAGEAVSLNGDGDLVALASMPHGPILLA
jgi:hypothetical protein